MHDELRDALRRVEPPKGFADRVLQQAARDSQPSRQPARFPGLVKLAVAATLVIAIAGGAWYRVEERRREGEEAKRQVLVSLGLAGSKLREVTMRINHQQER